MTQKHTALPWIVHQRAITNVTGGNLNVAVAACGGWDDNTRSDVFVEQAHNAAFICRAVNSHYELLSALKDATRIVEQCGQWQDTNETTTQIFKEEIEKFEAAIAKAEAAE